MGLPRLGRKAVEKTCMRRATSKFLSHLFIYTVSPKQSRSLFKVTLCEFTFLHLYKQHGFKDWKPLMSLASGCPEQGGAASPGELCWFCSCVRTVLLT